MKLKFQKMLKLTQEQLLEFCVRKLIQRGFEENSILSTPDYILAEGDIPILLVAHCDIVHKNPPETIVYDSRQKIMWSPTGIGGDDRCGVFSILKICEEFKPWVLFTTEEEKGGIGVRKFTKEFESLPINFIIEIDRRGNNQVVFYDCGNEEFQNYIISFGFDLNYGSYSDVSTLSTHFDIAGCNLSAGYYNEHIETEHIYIEHMENTIEKVKKILADTENHKKYDCQEKKYNYKGYYGKYYGSYYSDWYDELYDEYYIPKKQEKQEIKVTEVEEETENDIEENNEEYKEVYAELLALEEDYYSLTRKQWYRKYGYKKPKDVTDIYFYPEY